MFKKLLSPLIFLGLSAISVAQPTTPVEIKHLSTYHTGIFDDGAAEIVSYDEIGKRVYVTNSSTSEIMVVDINDPYFPTLVNTIDISSYGGGVNSIVVWNGFLAAAIENANPQLDGIIVFFDTAGTYLNQVTVGPLPDMIQIAPDHSKLVVANEGEPDDDYIVDPNGSISIIDLTNPIASISNSDVTTVDFSTFESHRQSFESATIDNWSYTITPVTYSTEGDSIVGGSEDIWGVIQEFSGNINNGAQGQYFWGMQDLDNPNGGGSMWHTLDFDPIDISSQSQAWVSFKYHSVGYESSDSIGYIIEYNNGTSWNMASYVDLHKDTSWSTIRTQVPNGSTYVRLRLMAKQNGGSDYAAFDDIQLSFLDSTVRIFGNDYFATVAQDLEPEYVCIEENSQYAVITLQENNAFARVNLSTGVIEEVQGLGFKDHSTVGNGIDASNTAPSINITTWPVKGMYLPDALDCFMVNGTKYYITANEGDSRDYDGYSEEDRVKDLTLDSTYFPNYATLQNDDELGRLNITLSMGDIDYDGEYEELYSYGARSFSIFDEFGNLVYDSGDEFEQIIAAEMPAYFNSNNDDNSSFKSRSDDKGPEPEAVTIGVINDRYYAFVGLERIGGIMVYDVTDPTSPTYLQYLNIRNFSVSETDSLALDLAPEGIIFVPKAESPNLRDMIIVSNEVSGTVSMFQVDVNNTVAGNIALDTFLLASTPIIGMHDGNTYHEGGISGLHYKHGSNDEYYLITDRGPNAIANNHPLAAGNAVKFFPFPAYAPKIFEVSAVAGNLNITKTTELKRPNGSSASGVPLPAGSGSTGEVAWSDLSATTIAADNWGIDSEGIVEDNNGDFWICDEYGSSVWKTNDTMKTLERYTPFILETEDVAIDTMIGKRRPNRGFEGVAYTPNGKIYAILQSPVYNPSSTASDNSQIHRILEIDPVTGTQQMYAYVHQAPIGQIRNKDWKIGDLVAVNNTEFLVIEHAQRNGWNYKDVFKFDISSATPITVENFSGSTLEELIDESGLLANSITPVQKTHFLDLLESGWQLQHDKPEGITIVNDSTIALVNDNDYGIDAPADDGNIVFTGKTTLLYKYSLPSGSHLSYIAPYCDVVVSNDTTICDGDLASISASTGFTGYHWNTTETTTSIDVSSAGTYSVAATTADGCIATDSLELFVNPLPQPQLGNDTTLCGSEYMVLSPGSFSTYNWNSSSTSSFELIDGSIVGPGQHEIIVEVTDMNACSKSDTIVVTVNELPFVDLGSDTLVCANTVPITLDAGSASNYLWSTGAVTQTISVSTTDVYSVVVTDADGCENMDEITVWIQVCLGVEENTGAELSIYPNPAHGQVTIEYPSNVEHIQLVNALGATVRTINAGNTNRMSMDLDGLPAGTYFMVIASDNDQVTKKLIIK